jgi:hypothetical protein
MIIIGVAMFFAGAAAGGNDGAIMGLSAFVLIIASLVWLNKMIKNKTPPNFFPKPVF